MSRAKTAIETSQEPPGEAILPLGKGKDYQGLTERQRAFAEAWAGVAKRDGTKAAEIAGYAGTRQHLSEQSSKLLRHPNVAGYIRELLGEAYERAREFAIATEAECIAALTNIVRADTIGHPGDYIDERGEIDITAVKEAPPGVISEFELVTTTDEEGQVFSRAKIKLEPASKVRKMVHDAARTLLEHHAAARGSGLGQQITIVNVVNTLPAPSQVSAAKALLGAGKDVIKVEAKRG